MDRAPVSWRVWAVWGALGVLLVALPFLPLRATPYLVSFLFVLLSRLVLAAGYDLVGGHMGYINLGHVTFYGIGGYAFAIALSGGYPFPVALALALALPVVFAALMSVPFFRLRGAYFALAAFSLVLLVETLALNLRGITKGSAGLYLTPGFRNVPAYYLALVIAAGTLLTNLLITRSRFGLALASIREDEQVAQDFGVNLLRYKTLALLISAASAGLMGGVVVWQISFADPELLFGLEIALVPIVMAMLGGSGTIVGPILGALFVDVVQTVLWTRLAYLHLATYGVLLALVGLLMPGGLARSAPVRRAFAAVAGVPYSPR